MFPVLPNEFFVFSVFWIACHDPWGRRALLIAIYSTTRNTGNIRNSIEKPEVGPDFSWNTTGNTGNAPADGHSRRQRNSICLNQAWWRADPAVQGDNTHVTKHYTVEKLAPNVLRNYSQWG
jgi:hypothetical protein